MKLRIFTPLAQLNMLYSIGVKPLEFNRDPFTLCNSAGLLHRGPQAGRADDREYARAYLKPVLKCYAKQSVPFCSHIKNSLDFGGMKKYV